MSKCTISLRLITLCLLLGMAAGLKCYSYANVNDDSTPAVKQTVDCSTVGSGGLGDPTKSFSDPACWRANSADAAAACGQKGKACEPANNLLTKAYKDLGADYWCSECTTDFCNNAPGLRAGLTMAAFATVVSLFSAMHV
jgi:hypothetical protein